jgi:uncharacterized protein
MPIIVSFFIFITLLGTMYPQRDIPRGELRITPGLAGEQYLSLRNNVKPLNEEFTYKNVVKQEFDYSCGSAALATLLNFYLGEKLSEQQVIQGLMQYGDAEKIQERRAFSLLDMKRFVEVLGYTGAGYKAELDDIRSLKKPAIVPIELAGYKHFVVLRAIHGNHVYFADPFRGNTSFTLETFREIWSQNIIFVISTENAHLKALALKDEDLRVIDFDMTQHALTQILPPRIVTDQRQITESIGGTYYKTVNIK